MGLDCQRERRQVIAAFEHRHDAALAGLVGKADHPLGEEAEIGYLEAQPADRVCFISIEPGRDQD